MVPNESFRVYPRGFLGTPTLYVPERNTSAVEARLHHVNSGANPNPEKAFGILPHPTIQRLYKEYLRGNHGMTSMDFREQVLSYAVKAFGTRDFYVWVMEQFQSDTVGDPHRKFLEDTLQFIDTGAERRVPVIRWQFLITDPNHRDNVDKHIPESVQKFFGCNSDHQRNIDLLDVLQSWLGRTGGFGDLVGTLHLLFGQSE